MNDLATPQAAVSQDDINAAVWAACDTFRGTVDPSIYKDYVLTMLFLKYVSDVWQDHYDHYKAQYGDHPELIAEMLKNERFVLPASASFYALHALRHTPGNGERIDKALHAIEEANLGKLRDVFQDISFNSNKLGDEQQKNDILRHLLEDFAKPELNLRESRVGQLDVIGNAYEFLIKNFASTSGKKAGEFYTPPEVSTLMARLMDPQAGEKRLISSRAMHIIVRLPSGPPYFSGIHSCISPISPNNCTSSVGKRSFSSISAAMGATCFSAMRRTLSRNALCSSVNAMGLSLSARPRATKPGTGHSICAPRAMLGAARGGSIAAWQMKTSAQTHAQTHAPWRA